MSTPEQLRDHTESMPAATSESENAPQIKIAKTVTTKQTDGTAVLAEIFTMTIGNETIQLIPLKNWMQLDLFKWRARGILPRTPAGLEITWTHTKAAGQTVSPWDPDACERLEQALNEWLALERKNVEAAAKAKPPAAQAQAAPAAADDEEIHFQLDLSNAAQPRLRCLEGSQTVKLVALNMPGLTALIEQGLMRAPKAMKVGALHNWVELDGQMFRFDQGPDGAKEFERFLNDHYVIAGAQSATQDVSVFVNPASPSGFDIQFPATPNGLVENRKRHLDPETVELLQDTQRCRVLRKALTARFAPPDLIFKLKTPEGGECYLEASPENMVSVTGPDGRTRTIDLSKPVSLLNLGVPELTAVFNHPSINRRARLAKKGAGHE